MQPVAVVTGASSGIGAATAAQLAGAGFHVVLAARRADRLEQAAARARERGGSAQTELLDVTDTEAVVSFARSLDRCDVLVNNAGVGHVGTILTTEPGDLDRLWRVNLLGAYYLSRAVLPAMIEQRAGSIINIGSIAAITGMESRFAYTITKHAILGLTRSMAMDHGVTGVRINCICPGRTQTPFVEARLKEYADPREYMKQMVAPHALKRMAQPSEIAAAALFLASDESSFVTGSALAVDGGYTAGK